MKKGGKGDKRPFYETIIEAINACFEPAEFLCLIDLIKNTKIPENHDAIIEAWKTRMDIFGYNHYGVPDSVAAQKPAAIAANHREIMDSADSLEKAIELAFDNIPLGGKHSGPKGSLFLIRNSVPKGHQDVAEVSVLSLRENDDKILFTAYWDKDFQTHGLGCVGGNKLEDWNYKW